VILENEPVNERVNNKDSCNPLTSVDSDKQENGSRSESEEQSTLIQHAMGDMDIPSKLSCQHISIVELRKNKTEQVRDSELSLLPL